MIRTLFTNQLSSLGINPQIKTLILLDFSSKQEPMLTIQSAISIGEFMKRLLVPHNTTTFFSDGGITKFLARQSTFSARSPPIPKFNAFHDIKYLCHTFKEDLLSWNLLVIKCLQIDLLRGENGSGDILTSLIF